MNEELSSITQKDAATQPTGGHSPDLLAWRSLRTHVSVFNTCRFRNDTES